jgi:cytidine deaminase
VGSIPITRSIMKRDALVAAARACCRRAHAPYSGVLVGAALRSAGGNLYRGTNVENGAYPLGNCAETSAIAAGVQAEGKRFRIAEIAVWATDRGGKTLAASPCGGCRQRIRELAAGDEVPVHFPWDGGKVRTAAIGDLLPFAFFLRRSRRRK